MEQALKVIQFWCEADKRDSGFVDHAGIIKMCKKALKDGPDAKDVRKAEKAHARSKKVES